MMNSDLTVHKLKVLKAIVRELTLRFIDYELGGSAMLFLRNIVTHFNDLDFFVNPEQYDLAKNILTKTGMEIGLPPSEIYFSKNSNRFRIDDVEVDLIADFTIVHVGQTHVFPISRDNYGEIIEFDGISIRLFHLQTWQTICRLLGKEDKANEIALYLKKHPR